MEQLSIGQKCYIVNASREPGMYIGLVKAINNNQYEILVSLPSNKSELRNFDVSSGKEVGDNPKFRLSVRKYVYTNPKEILAKLNETKQAPVKVPTIQSITEETKEEQETPKTRKKKTTKKKTTKTVEEPTE